MKRLLFVLALVAALGPPALAQRTVYVTPDVPTDDPGGSGVVFQPCDVVAHKAGIYTLVLSLLPNTAIDALHKLDRAGRWLLAANQNSDNIVALRIHPETGLLSEPQSPVSAAKLARV